MKKTKLFCIFFLIFSQVCIFGSEKLVNFSTGLSTGFPSYGKESLNDSKKISTNNRIIIGTFANINFNAIEQARFFAGVDLFTDFSWNDNNAYDNFLHVDFPIGFRFYPNLGGLNLGLAYTLGFRANFYGSEKIGKNTDVSSWGNGFKFFLEYDFSYGSRFNLLPALGCSWTCMPRGNNAHDNLITFYISESF